jgi:transcriptional/translational regulatory protein YebC/TACO1
MFTRKAVFKILGTGRNLEDLELELIDHGLSDMKEEEDNLIALYCEFTDFGTLQKALEERNLEVQSSELVRIPGHSLKITDDQAEEVIKLIEKMEEDDDVVNVFHNMDMSE